MRRPCKGATGATAAALVAVALLASVCPTAAAAGFGGWTVSTASAGTAIQGLRSSITRGPSAWQVGSQPLILMRVTVQSNNGSAVGLIQAGLGRTNATTQMDHCGVRTVVTSYVEYKPMFNGINYVCEWGAAHDVNVSKKYSVAHTSQCAGCWTAFIDGVAKVQMNLSTPAGGAFVVDAGGATGETNASSYLGEYMQAEYGPAVSGATPWQRSTNTCCSGTTWVTISVPAGCQNTDDHWWFNVPFGQTFELVRPTTNGPNC